MAEENEFGSIHLGASSKLFSYARQNRRKGTEAERLLWEHLRNRKLNGLKFRRQHPLKNFVADFYCHEAKLAIELDGEVHNMEEQQDYDLGRTYELNELGITVIRLTNQQVFTKTDEVLNQIKKQTSK